MRARARQLGLRVVPGDAEPEGAAEQKRDSHITGLRPPSRIAPVEPPSGNDPEPGATTRDIPLDELYARYAPYVAAIAMRILGREGEVHDLVQDVFTTAVRRLRRREQHAEIRSWLAKVTVHRSLHQLRMRAFWAIFDLAEAPNYERIPDPRADPEEKRMIAEVYRALDRLPNRLRVPWVLRYVEGESLQDVAKLCGCSLATAKRRILAAHTKISSQLDEREPARPPESSRRERRP
jgi:RNA polymerase sigma-70 factor, ECF subfamily